MAIVETYPSSSSRFVFPQPQVLVDRIARRLPRNYALNVVHCRCRTSSTPGPRR